MTKNKRKLIPLFDLIDTVANKINYLDWLTPAQNKDYEQAVKFLRCYSNNDTTLNAYRREVERLLQWIMLKANKTLKQLAREDIDSYIKFCQKPSKSWISLKRVPRFITTNNGRIPNTQWRPFVVTLAKKQISEGVNPQVENYELSPRSIQDILTITSSFFNFLMQEDYVKINPVMQIKQKSKYFTKQQTQRVVRKLSELQWGYILESAHLMAKENSNHARTLFIMSVLYGMYLRISELTASARWTPKMGDFERDPDGLWWFATVGKGNKSRKIAVSTEILKALKRWRKYLGLSALPSPGETTPMIPKHIGKGSMTSTRHIRTIVQECFDHAKLRLEKDNLIEEAEQLMVATVHWLRHTGISEDVKIRPREHVRDDAGHSSSAITDKYIDVELRERHQSAKKKQITPAGFAEEIDKINAV